MEALIVAICLVNTQLTCQIQLAKPVPPKICKAAKADTLAKARLEMAARPGLVIMVSCMKAVEEPA